MSTETDNTELLAWKNSITAFSRYAYALDGRDWEMLRGCFTEDATFDTAHAGAVPGRRNAKGKRTAWLRPCMKIFAMPVSDIRFAF